MAKEEIKKEVVKVEEKEIVETKNIRTLLPNEIDVRVSTINEKGASLLLYKDARVDMKILDEIYGNNNWQRTHEVINGNLFCNISIWDEEKKQWVVKQDVGTESYTEKEKGQASDSFKRAGFNIGIGRELYTSPFIWVKPLTDKEFFKNQRGLFTTYTKFSVKEIDHNEEREIVKLTIIDNNNKVRFKLENEKDYRELLMKFIEEKGFDMKDIAVKYKLNAKSTNNDFKEALEKLKNEADQ